ncbi:hypothetical protein OKW23_001415 [Bacilli bacterium PM5-9]|nr:hypothetical protein [Bacilli bacterium PM5-9]
MIIDINKTINLLANERKIFHSEADFQFSFAWKIKEVYPKANIRLEYINNDIKNMHIDVLIELNNYIIPIELKYVTKFFVGQDKGEKFILKDHGAQDLRRYDFIRDIERIEYCKKKLMNFKEGYAIMVTNDKSYYQEYTRDKITNCHDFRIHDGKTIEKKLIWRNNPSIGTIKGRERDIKLSKDYNLKWSRFSLLKEEEFKVLVVKVV